MNLQTPLRLFAIRSTETGRIIPNTYFRDKKNAKAERDRLGKDKHTVTPGPDHARYAR